MKLNLLIALAGLFIFSFSAQAQILWQKSIGLSNAYETANCMTQLKIGGYVMAGYQRVGLSVRAYIVRTDENGDTLWTNAQQIPGFNFANITSITEDTDGNLIAGGSGNDGQTINNTNGFLLKLNPNGDTIWSKTFITPQYDWIGNIKIGNDSTYIIPAILGGISKLLKMETNGNITWSQNHAFSSTDQGGVGMAYPINNGYLAFILSDYLTAQMRVALLDEQGNQLTQSWNLIWPAYSFYKDSANNFLIVNGNRLHKLNPQGDTLWSRSYRIGTRYFSPLYTTETDDGNYLLFGEYNNGNDDDLALMKVDTAGTVLKDTVFFRYGANELARGVAISPQGDYVLAGYTDRAPNNSADMILLKYKRWDASSHVGTKKQLQSQPTLQAYPNPATDAINIQSEMPISGNLALYNLQGQKILQKNVNQQDKLQLSLNQLPSGLYILHFTNDKGLLSSFKILKQ